MPEPNAQPQVPPAPATAPQAAAPPPQPPPAPAPQVEVREEVQPEVIIYSHSSLFYWWPVWVVSYALAAATYWDVNHQRVLALDASAVVQDGRAEAPAKDIHRNRDGDKVVLHRSSSLGAVFFVTLFLVILITNVTVRGLASALVIMTLITVTVVLAYFDLWDPILNWLGGLKIYLNLGAYFWFGTLMFVVWLLTVFVFDRLSYWRIKPGQVTHEFVLGAASRSYDTENMVLEKYRDDFFRHWVLGFGSGDLHIKPYGSEREEISIPNVLFIGSKVNTIQHMIATEPEKFGHTVLR